MGIPLDTVTDEQREIVELVRQFTEEQVIPVASRYEREDRFPDEIVDGLRELGIFGFTKRDFFDAEPEASAVPTVDLNLS